jgi:hypothetical protein
MEPIKSCCSLWALWLWPIPLLEDGNEAAKNSLALYRYTGFFEADRAGEYLFATASNWGSHLLVDDKLVVSWPGDHNYREGIRGQKREGGAAAGCPQAGLLPAIAPGHDVRCRLEPPGSKLGHGRERLSRHARLYRRRRQAAVPPRIRPGLRVDVTDDWRWIVIRSP